MFEEYPKKRINLPDTYRKIYLEHYKNNREGKTASSKLAQSMEHWLHKKVASDVKPDKTTLEIGAGTLNQLHYEKTTHYDIIEPNKALYEKSPHLKYVNDIYTDINDISESLKYDRIISIATFEHIENLPNVVAKTCLLIKPNGTLRVSIPNEGTILWKLGWKLTTGLEFRFKYGLNYGLLMRYEHVNTANEIEKVLKYFYSIIKCSTRGLNKKIAFYRFYECTEPNIERARKYLS
jgi:hypothetical protein